MASVYLTVSDSRAGPALLFDTRYGEVFHTYGAFTPWHPASLTKLMTAYVTFEAIKDGKIHLDTPVQLPNGAALPSGQVVYKPGTAISLEEALEVMLTASLNQVAEAIAEAVDGSTSTFVAEMNANARRLGMIDTNYVNPHGLYHALQRTTARDLAVLTRALIHDFPEHQRFFGMRSVSAGTHRLANRNALLDEFAGADGMKTGYVCESGYNIIATATRGDRRLAAIVLGAASEQERNDVAATLLERGFERRSFFTLPTPATARLDRLKRPLSIGASIDMRPYVCGKSKPPQEIVSFGLGDTSAAEKPVLLAAPEPANIPLPRDRPSNAHRNISPQRTKTTTGTSERRVSEPASAPKQDVADTGAGKWWLPSDVYLTVLCETNLARYEETNRRNLLDDIRRAVGTVPNGNSTTDSIRLIDDSDDQLSDELAIARTETATIAFCGAHQFGFHSTEVVTGFPTQYLRRDAAPEGYSATVFALGTFQGCGTQCAYDGEYIVMTGDPVEELYIAPVGVDASGDHLIFDLGAEPLECQREFRFLRSGIELNPEAVRIPGALRVSVTCGRKDSGCVFEMPYSAVTLEQVDGIHLFQGTRLRQFDPFSTSEYIGFVDGAVWSPSVFYSGSPEERQHQREAVELCAQAVDRFEEPNFRAQIRELGASAMMVNGARVPLD